MNNPHSQFLLRRFSFDKMKEDIDNIVDYELNPCEFDNVDDFIGKACEMLAYRYFEDSKLSDKESEKLYPSIVNLFEEHLTKVYNKKCVKGLRESKKRIIVTESQYKRLFEQKKLKVEIFQDLINNKLEYIRKVCNEDLDDENYSEDVKSETCTELEMIDSIKVDGVNIMTGAKTDMSSNMYDSTPSIYIKLIINYSNLRDRYDFDEITYDLKNILKKSIVGLPIVFDYRTNNLNKNKEW